MPQSISQVWLHIVFATKERRAYLKPDEFQKEMFCMLAHHVKECGCTGASIGGMADHVHLLVGMSRTISIAKLVEQVKVETSKWAKKRQRGLQRFAWQSGYGVFSVSHSNRNTVDRYIRNQAVHHRKLTFQDEFRELCTRHGTEIDERFCWD